MSLAYGWEIFAFAAIAIWILRILHPDPVWGIPKLVAAEPLPPAGTDAESL